MISIMTRGGTHAGGGLVTLGRRGGGQQMENGVVEV